MKFAIHSDWHIEFGYVPLWNYTDETKEQLKESYFLFAGDLSSSAQEVATTLEQLSKLCKGVIFVSGNHEYYGSDIKQYDKHLEELLTANRVAVIQNSTIELDDVIVFGSTFWTDYNNNSERAMLFSKQNMNDYRYIRCEDRTLHPKDLYTIHQESLKHIEDFIALETPKKKVVMTHHSPTHQGGTIEFRDSVLNSSFCSDHDKLIQSSKLSLWVHGHQHSQKDLMIGETRVVCNPHGYPRERSYQADFNDRSQPLFVEV